MENRLGYVYILTYKNNHVLYTGLSSNMMKRTEFHKKAYLSGFTKKYNVNKLVYYEVFADIVSARVREHEIKGWKREKKIGLIESMNPKWENLYNRMTPRYTKKHPEGSVKLERDPSALRPQDDPSLHGKTPRGVS